MRSIELEKSYHPKSFEDSVYQNWCETGAFEPHGNEDTAYTIVIPPPNVTGVLHLGHALNITLQDIIIRFHRMRGTTLWVPGTDHAGIATQNIVEKKLRAKGLSRRELGREKFIEEAWNVKNDHHALISRQIAKMGASVDWTRERFTLDTGLSAAVREVFVTLYERGLIYKGEYLVNWCSSCGTALADDEVEHEETGGKMYHLRYPRKDGKGFVEIATTRPETLLGDTAAAVHPNDERYKEIVSKTILLPLTGREIPVIADEYVDRTFGTGVVKITPAHDVNDWEVGKRHGLPVINILNPNGTLNENAPEKYRGLSVKEAREAVLNDLKEGGFFIDAKEITHAVGHCYRCHTVIEPFLSEQWFVRMKPLAEKALAAWRRGEIIFHPKKWENTYQHWLENIRDWCISRQLWWGHRIPVWTCTACGERTVSRSDIDNCPCCGGKTQQDDDVLDTWFSSWLWPFSVFGWPQENTADYRRFYPTTALVTGYDIIFFWVSRMIMAGLEFTGKTPFRDIYLHGLLRDKQGRKMSKTLGNGIDPLEIVDEYGADAMKFTLAFLCAQGQDILLDKEAFKLGSRFANKIWNASRYILMNLENRKQINNPDLLPVDRWIYSRLAGAAKTISTAFEAYRYNEAASAAYEYFWNDFCDWYVEATKLSTKQEDCAEKDRAVTVLLDVLTESLKLVHPLLPFVTEEIYGKIQNCITQNNADVQSFQTEFLVTSRYPSGDHKNRDAVLETDFAFMQEVIRAMRTMRSECTIPPEKKIRAAVIIENKKHAQFLREHSPLIKLLANLNELTLWTNNESESAPDTNSAVGSAGTGFEAYIYIAEAVDIALLLTKWKKDAEADAKFIKNAESKLANENFIKNAPSDIIMTEKAKLEDIKIRAKKIDRYISRFSK
ncbi:MAG: valine--tRNA ligase [Spirochaetaceae bacterium]|nr:valine--tRNA ligase [Spirochaetaceae bacterium]